MHASIWSNVPEDNCNLTFDAKGGAALWCGDHKYTAVLDQSQVVTNLDPGASYQATFALGDVGPFVNCGSAPANGKCASTGSANGLVLTVSQDHFTQSGPVAPIGPIIH